MTSVYFDPALGGDGSTVSDDADPTTGLKKGGHRTRFALALNQMIAMIGFSKTQAQAAAASAASALGAPGTSATSTTNTTAIGTGSKTITLTQTGKLFTLGQTMVWSDGANANNLMIGVVTAFSPGTGVITMNATYASAANTPTSWNCALAATSGVASVAGLSGVVTSAALKTALGITVGDITDYVADQLSRANTLKAFAVGMAASL